MYNYPFNIYHPKIEEIVKLLRIILIPILTTDKNFKNKTILGKEKKTNYNKRKRELRGRFYSTTTFGVQNKPKPKQ